MRILIFSALLIISLTSCKDDGNDDSPIETPHQTTPVELSFDGYPNIIIPENNPTTVEGVELGRYLFYSPSISCNSCHTQEKSFSVPNNIPITIQGHSVNRNVMPLINLAWVDKYSWGGRDESGLESKVKSAIENSSQRNYADVISELKLSSVDYPQMFFEAFGSEEITENNINKALAQFLRTLTVTKSRAQKYIEGDITALNSFEQFGFTLFFGETGNCFHCHLHSNKLFTDNSFRNNGLDSLIDLNEFEDFGAYYQTGVEFDKGKFRSVTLLNIAQTAPYMHDGRFETLEEVMDHYNSGGKFSPNIDNLIDEDPAELGLALTEEEKAALIAYMQALTDTSFLNNPNFGNPFE